MAWLAWAHSHGLPERWAATTPERRMDDAHSRNGPSQTAESNARRSPAICPPRYEGGDLCDTCRRIAAPMQSDWRCARIALKRCDVLARLLMMGG
jgi:hypothetical protein